MEKKLKPKLKRRKPQGKINKQIVLEGVLRGDKAIDIAPRAGSLAESDSAKGLAVNRVINSDAFQELLEQELPDGKLLGVHKRILNKEEVFSTKHGIVHTGQIHSDAKGALDMAYKLKKKYPTEGTGNTYNQINVLTIEQENRIIARHKEFREEELANRSD